MLSRVAERMYWLGRYIERTENTARLIMVNASLQLDLPRGVKPPWHALTDIMDLTDDFYQSFKVANEQNVIKFMLADERNPNSLIQSVRNARENARTTREILPTEAFELINELNFIAKDRLDHALARGGRHEYLDSIINQCHQLTGLLFGTMSHDIGYTFVRLGRNLERADMTTRIVDVGSAKLLDKDEALPDHYETALWMNVLRSLSAYQMYRQHVPDRINAEDVVEFLLKNKHFPRSVAHCITDMEGCCADLPRGDDPRRTVVSVVRTITDTNVPKIIDKDLHHFIDDLQLDLAVIHDHIAATWFDLDHASVSAMAAASASN